MGSAHIQDKELNPSTTISYRGTRKRNRCYHQRAHALGRRARVVFLESSLAIGLHGRSWLALRRRSDVKATRTSLLRCDRGRISVLGGPRGCWR